MKDFLLLNEFGHMILMAVVMLLIIPLCCLIKPLSKVKSRALRGVATAFLCALVAVATLGPTFAWLHFKGKAIRAKRTASAPAVVVKHENSLCGADFETMYPCTAVYYHYQDAGQEKEGITGFSGKQATSYHIGETFKVCFDPNNQENRLLYLQTESCTE